MNVFDNLNNSWIQVRDDLNKFTIEDFDYSTGVIKEKVGNHCVKCTSANMCWFKNEKNKKPEPLLLSKIDILNNIFKGIVPGLYHPHCHCIEMPIFSPTPDIINLIIPPGKINWLLKDKNNWVKSLGYNSIEDFIITLNDTVKLAYCKGNYEIIEHSKYGCKANLFLDFPGSNEKIGNIYKLKSAFMIFPNGKLKCNTLLGGWYK